jgi:hypothetical protein
MNLFLYLSKCILVSKLLIILGFAKSEVKQITKPKVAKSECKEGWGQWIVIDE